MPSGIWRRRVHLAVCLMLAFTAAALADAPPGDSTTPKSTADAPGTTVYMGQLRKLFDKWDLNSDGYLDKQELAKAFRGPEAKPYDFNKAKDSDKDAAADVTKEGAEDVTTAKKPDSKKYPDHDFLVQLDQDNDGKISRDEFMSWARDYAVQLKDQAAQEKKLLSLETRLQSASARESKTIERELKREQAKLDKLTSGKLAAEKTIEQHLKGK
jgi:Ca2+-binding EF-hand superfamily protein